MEIKETSIPGAFIIKNRRFDDVRGCFVRLWDSGVLKDKGLQCDFLQVSYSTSLKKGTLRGMHFQKKPHWEDKIVSCIKGRIFDVIIDLRKDSKTFKNWEGFNLTGGSGDSLYIPKGLAHGYLTLEDDSLVLYGISEKYLPDCAAGIRWDDPEIGIMWPGKVKIISEKDKLLPRLSDAKGDLYY